MAKTNASPRRDPGELPPVPRRQTRRYWSHLVLFAASALLVNGLFGDRGFLESARARRSYVAAEQQLVRLRQENAALRERARLLSNDPGTIEAVARGELGMMRPGEILVTVRDLKK